MHRGFNGCLSGGAGVKKLFAFISGLYSIGTIQATDPDHCFRIIPCETATYPHPPAIECDAGWGGQ